MKLEGNDKNYMLVPLRATSKLDYEFDADCVLQMIGEHKSDKNLENDLVFSELDCRRLYTIDKSFIQEKASEKPKSKDESVLK